MHCHCKGWHELDLLMFENQLRKNAPLNSNQFSIFTPPSPYLIMVLMGLFYNFFCMGTLRWNKVIHEIISLGSGTILKPCGCWEKQKIDRKFVSSSSFLSSYWESASETSFSFPGNNWLDSFTTFSINMHDGNRLLLLLQLEFVHCHKFSYLLSSGSSLKFDFLTLPTKVLQSVTDNEQSFRWRWPLAMLICGVMIVARCLRRWFKAWNWSSPGR